MIIALDTNIVVAGVLKLYSIPAAILRLVAEGTIKVAYDLRVLTEYRDVLARSKFNFPHEAVKAFLDQVEQEGILISPRPLKKRLPDPDDEPVLEVASAARAMAIVTGNKRHFPQKECEGIRVLSPAEFMVYFRKMI